MSTHKSKERATEWSGPYESAFDVIDDKDRAANLKMRSKLMNRLDQYVKEHGLNQTEAAKHFGVNQSDVSRLVNGRISAFTIDKLVNMCSHAGIKVDVSFDGAYA